MTTIDIRDEPVRAARKLTGMKVLLIFLAGFGTVATANGIMIHYALSTFPGVTDDRAYEHGLAYDRDIATAHKQDSLGWKVDGRIVRELNGQASIALSVRDARGEAVHGLRVAGNLEFLPDRRLDRALALVETAAGEYRAGISATPGSWMLDVTASREGEALYRSRNRLKLQ